MMIYSRGAPAEFDEWEKLGATGWSWKDVEPYFKKMETTDDAQLAGRYVLESSSMFYRIL